MAYKARIYNGVKTVSSINDVGKMGQMCAKKVNSDHFLVPYIKIQNK